MKGNVPEVCKIWHRLKKIFQKREKYFIQRDLINKGEPKNWEIKGIFQKN
jgi:hypothetical protein